MEHTAAKYGDMPYEGDEDNLRLPRYIAGDMTARRNVHVYVIRHNE